MVFAALLVISTAIGVYFGWKDRKTKDDKNYALGRQQFSAVPVALSLTATSLAVTPSYSLVRLRGMPPILYGPWNVSSMAHLIWPYYMSISHGL